MASTSTLDLTTSHGGDCTPNMGVSVGRRGLEIGEVEGQNSIAFGKSAS